MKRGIRIIIYVVIALTVLYFGVQWFLEAKIKNIAEEKMSEMTQGAVRVEIGSVSLHLIGRSLWLKEVKISSDTNALHKTELPFKNVEGYFKRLGVRGIHFEKRDSVIYLRAKEFGADLSWLSADRLKQDPVSRDSGQRIPGLQLQVEAVNVRLGRILCRTIDKKDTVEYRLNDFNGKIREGEFNTFSRNRGLPLSCRDIRLALSSFQYRFGDNSSLLEIDSLQLQGEEGRFAVGAIRLLPLYDMYEFARKAPGHTDWTQIEAYGLSGTGFGLQKLIAGKFISMDSVSLEKASIRSFKNRQIEQTPKIKRLFYESVQEFPFPLAVRRIALNQVFVEYLELAKNGLSPGRITFNDLQGMFYDLTNRVTSGHPVFTLEAKGKLMDQGEIQATFRLPVDSLNPFFEIDGKLGPLNLTALNPMIEPLAKIKIVSGRMEEMTFGIQGNSQKAGVDMSFLYEHLRIRIMKEKDGELETSSFLTTLANGLIVKENNPDHRGIRQGEGSAERDPYRSQFNYFWKILLVGLKESVGL